MPYYHQIKPRGLPELDAFFRQYPKHVRGIVAEAVADDVIGNGQRGLKHYPRYTHIPRRQAFGRPFQSDRQRRFVMAAIRAGRIDPGFPKRTGKYQRSWVRVGSGVGSRIEGQLPHEGFPNRLAAKVGWREPMKIIMANLAHAVRHAESKLNAWFRSKGY